MAVSVYEDKTYFLTNRFLEFYMGVEPLPRIHGDDEEKYYFMEDINTLVANKNDKNVDSIKKVYQWLLDASLNNEKIGILNFKSEYYQVYGEYDKHDNFTYEKKDPTATLGFNQNVVNSLFYDGIRGSRKVEEVIARLNGFMKRYTDEVKQKDKTYFDNYIDKE